VHDLTGQAYLTYHKKRSKGDKELHLSLLDSGQKSVELSLIAKQSSIIRGTIDLIFRLTAPLLTTARKEDLDYLFLSQTRGGGRSFQPGGVVRLSRGHLSDWTSKILKGHLALSATGVPTSFNLARFRPTKITQMVKDGYDFFAIQAAAGHGDAKTTWNYLATHQLNPVAEREVTRTLIRIHKNSEELKNNPKPYASSESDESGVIYKGVIADCKNVFDPPTWIKRLPGYKPGQSCTLWNMCLLCPNVLITRKHLPRLVAYDREIEYATERNNLSHAPNAVQYQKTRAVLAGILEDFGEEDVRRAREIAEQSDYHLDAVTYRGVKHPDSCLTTSSELP
jgi:hypothetical protein